MLATLKVESTDDSPARPDEQDIVEQLLRDCAGDPQKAMLGLVRLAAQLVQKNDQLASVISSGFVRRKLYDACP